MIPSRRAFLAGIAAAPALAAPALATASLLPHPDAALFALEEQLTAALDHADVVGKPWTQAEETMFAWKRSNPKPIWPVRNTEVDNFLCKLFQTLESRGNPSEVAVPALNADFKASLGEHLEAMELSGHWYDREKAAKANCHYDETEAEWLAAQDEIARLCEEIADTRANTLDGIQMQSALRPGG